jgi:phytoene/squalene synthetase
MTALTPKDRSFLEQIACQSGSVFSTCYRFTRPSFRDSLLVLRALLTEIVEIPSKVSDPGVARIKISWWKNELSVNPAQSLHPVVKALGQKGMVESLDHETLNIFFDGVFELSAGEPFEDSAALLGISRSIGGSEALLETSAGGFVGERKAITAIGSAGFIANLLNDISRHYCNESWWMPMNLRARYGITGNPAKGHDGLNEAIQWLAGIAMKELHQGIGIFRKADNESVAEDGLHYLKIKAGILHRRLKQLQKKPASHTVNPIGPGEILAAWWLAVRRF